MTSKLLGGCFCGAVRYEAAGLASAIGYCHCGTCRKTHSAPFIATALTPFEEFSWTKGRDFVTYIETSPGKHRYFCPACGTHMMAEYPAAKRRLLQVGSIESPLPRPAAVHIWTSEKAPYFDFCDDLPKLSEGLPPAD